MASATNAFRVGAAADMTQSLLTAAWRRNQRHEILRVRAENATGKRVGQRDQQPFVHKLLLVPLERFGPGKRGRSCRTLGCFQYSTQSREREGQDKASPT